MPRSSAHLVKSATRLLRQSTTVPNTSNTSAFTAEISDMSAPCSPIRHSGFDAAYRPRMPIPPSIEVEFLELAVIGLDVAHRAGDRAHHHGLGLDHVLAELDAAEQRTVGDAGGGKQAVAPHHVLDAIDHVRIVHAHLASALALLLGVENQ